MRMHPREFPPNRRGDPKRRAERQVYEALAGSDCQGFAYYEWRKGYEHIELDFAVWIENLGRFALQVKGGRYRLSDGEWYLANRDGLQPVRSCPLDEAKLAALDLHDDIAERARTSYNPYVIPVLLFPDETEPDPSIENLAKRKGVYVVWGAENLLEDLGEIVLGRSVSDQLTMGRIAAEVLAVTDGQIRLDAAKARKTAGRPALPLVLSLRVGGRSVLRVRTKGMRLQVQTYRSRVAAQGERRWRP